MAVYKPTYCYPYLESVDLTIPDGEKYFTCQIDTSNIKITGYRVELYNENNERVFPLNEGKISPLSELNDTDGTLGLNGSELRFPFVQHWDPKIYPSYNAIYFKATNYVDYYQLEPFDNIDTIISNGQLYYAEDGKSTNVPVVVDGSFIFVGDSLLIGQDFYTITLDGLGNKTGSLAQSSIVYVKGGDANAGKILQYTDGTFGESSSGAWCDIAGNPLTISNNGKTYKWQITLYSGEKGATRITGINSAAEISYDDLADNEFNTFLTSGTILGSTVDRIQGPVSDKIYAKQWLQLLNAEGEQIGQRTLIDSYSQSLGYIYPATGSLRSFTNDNLYSDTADQSSIATQFEIYKYSNNPDNLVGQEKIEHSINFSMMGNGATYNYGSYQYVVEGYQNIANFNQACGTDYPQLCQIDNNGQALYAGQQVLLWNITIVDQDLTAENFIPVNNTYYRHTGGTTETFVQGNVYLCVISYTGDTGAQEEVVTYTPYTGSQNPITGLFTISYTPPIEGAIVKQGTQTLTWPNRIFSVTTWDYISKTTPSGGVKYEYRAAIETSIRLPDTVSDVKVTKADGSIIELTSTNTLIESHISDKFSNNPLYNYYYARVVGNILYLTTEGKRTFAEEKPFGVRIYLRNDGITGATASYTYTEASPPKFVFDMISSYRKVSAYIGKVFFINSGPFAGTNIISEASASSTNDVVELGVPIVFKQEKPLEIYPTATVPASKTRGKIYKNNIDRDNNVGTVYVSPFVGLQAGARLYVSDGTVIKAQTVDTTTWAVTYAAVAPASTEAYSSINPLKYEIRTNFKSSDETPFYAYDTPRLVPWSEQALSVIGTNGYEFLLEFLGQILTVPTVFSSEIHARYVHVTGQYLQAQNVSWTSYRWLLVDEYGQVIQDTGKQYDGLMETTFYGLNGPTVGDVEAGNAIPSTYYPVLIVEDELGNSLIMGMKIEVSLNLRNLPMEFSGSFDCKTQSVIMKIKDYGYPKFSQDLDNKATVLDMAQGVNYPTEAEIGFGKNFVSITGENKSLKAVDQVKIPTQGAQLKHFFAKDTEEIPDLSKAPKKLATNNKGNIEFHTKVKLDANFCGEILKYSVDIFDVFGNTDKLNILLELPNNFGPQKTHDNDGLNDERNKVKCTVSTKDSSASASGITLFDLPSKNQEAYHLQPVDWINPNSGDLTANGNSNLEYLDFTHPFVKQVNGEAVSYVERKDYTNINEPINTKAKRNNIGECCLQVDGGNYFNKWTDLKRIQIETPAGPRVVQTAEPAVWNDTDSNGNPNIWTEGWNDDYDTKMVQVKRHAKVAEFTWEINGYLREIDALYGQSLKVTASSDGVWKVYKETQYKDSNLIEGEEPYVIIQMKEEAAQ